MNERIRELADQAGVSITAADKNGVFTLLPDNQKKFAELIVRECIQSIENTIETNCDTDSEKIGCEFAITDLKEHFGVQE